jgi:hypothetical protein
MNIKGKLTLRKVGRLVDFLVKTGIDTEPLNPDSVSDQGHYALLACEASIHQLDMLAEQIDNFFYSVVESALIHQPIELWGLIISVPAGVKVITVAKYSQGELVEGYDNIVVELDSPAVERLNVVVMIEVEAGASNIVVDYLSGATDKSVQAVSIEYEEFGEGVVSNDTRGFVFGVVGEA